MRIGSLFSGAGGLDMAVESVFGGRTVWHCEVDPSASKVLAERWPGVPNLGSVTDIDWATVEPVDIMCGGFPCQDVSSAGNRAGLRDGTRSGLWSHFAAAIDALRPQFVVIENVRGLLSAEAHRNVEPDQTVMGDGSDGPVLRALGAVLGDLADLGYDAQWATVAAASVGAPHRRERVFIVAHPARDTRRVEHRDCPTAAHSDSATRWQRGGFRETSGSREYSEGEARTRLRSDAGSGSSAAADTAGRRRSHIKNGGDSDRQSVGAIAGASDGDSGRNIATRIPILGRIAGELATEPAVGGDRPVELLPTPTAMTPHDTWTVERFDEWKRKVHAEGRGGGAHPDNRVGHSRQLIDYALLDGTSAWGKYEPAIRHWEQCTRPAPPPTEPNTKGNPRLSAAFAEWLMGWPAGWVTDIDISRNDMLRIIGNGVVPQQSVAALQWLLRVSQTVEAAS